MQAIGTYCVSACSIPIICSIMGCCWLLKTFVEDITNDLENFEAHDVFHETMDQNRIVKHFKNVAKSFVMVKQLSFYFLCLVIIS